MTKDRILESNQKIVQSQTAGRGQQQQRHRRHQDLYQTHEDQRSGHSHNSWPSISSSSWKFQFIGALMLLACQLPLIYAQSSSSSSNSLEPTVSTWAGTINVTIKPNTTAISFWQNNLLGDGGTINMSDIIIHTIVDDETTSDDAEESQLDLVVFRAKQECESPNGCDVEWHNLGLGAIGGLNLTTFYWCCTDDAVEQQLCDSRKLGRLIINEALFFKSRESDAIAIEIPSEGYRNTSLADIDGVFEMDSEGTYVMLMAQCNENGRAVHVEGDWTWNSIIPPADECGVLDNNIETQRGDIKLTLASKTDQIYYYERALPKNGMLDVTELRLSNYDDFIPPTTVDSVINFVVFRTEGTCDDSNGCRGADWDKHGIGVRHENGESHEFCCTDQNIQEGLCDAKFRGELIYNLNKTVDEDCGFLVSQDRLISVPKQGWVSVHVALPENAKLQNFAEGRYIILFANCNPNGRKMEMAGEMSWNSYQGNKENSNPLLPKTVLSNFEATLAPTATTIAPTNPPAPTSSLGPQPDSKPGTLPDLPSESAPQPTPTVPVVAPTSSTSISSPVSNGKQPATRRHDHKLRRISVVTLILACCVLFFGVRYRKMKRDRVKDTRKTMMLKAAEELEEIHDKHVEWLDPREWYSTRYRDHPDDVDNSNDPNHIEMSRAINRHGSSRTKWPDESTVPNFSRLSMAHRPPTNAFPPRINSSTGETINLAPADLL